jgi:hypothetical protein
VARSRARRAEHRHRGADARQHVKAIRELARDLPNALRVVVANRRRLVSKPSQQLLVERGPSVRLRAGSCVMAGTLGVQDAASLVGDLHVLAGSYDERPHVG